MPPSPDTERPLIWPMRALLYVGGGFVLVAGLQLWLLSGRTAKLFAWTIDSEMTAAFLGSCYWSAAVVALLSAREQTWAAARVGVPGVLAFVWLTLLATLMHLGLFHLDATGALAQAAAWVWLAIYVAEPALLLWIFIAQLRTPGGEPPRADPLPGPYRMALAALAAILVGFGAVLFIAPAEVGDAWPWQLTPLTGRAVGAWLIAFGGLLAAMWWEQDRGRVRLGVYALLTLVPLTTIALARYGDEVTWSQPAAFVLIAFLASVLGVGLYGLRTAHRSRPLALRR